MIGNILEDLDGLWKEWKDFRSCMLRWKNLQKPLTISVDPDCKEVQQFNWWPHYRKRLDFDGCKSVANAHSVWRKKDTSIKTVRRMWRRWPQKVTRISFQIQQEVEIRCHLSRVKNRIMDSLTHSVIRRRFLQRHCSWETISSEAPEEEPEWNRGQMGPLECILWFTRTKGKIMTENSEAENSIRVSHSHFAAVLVDQQAFS